MNGGAVFALLMGVSVFADVFFYCYYFCKKLFIKGVLLNIFVEFQGSEVAFFVLVSN